jgi:hypothetical protein
MTVTDMERLHADRDVQHVPIMENPYIFRQEILIALRLGRLLFSVLPEGVSTGDSA